MEPADAGVLALWALDPKFCVAADWTVGLTYEDCRSFHAKVIADPPADLVRFGAVHRGELVGYVDLHGQDPARRELGFVIGDSRRWGRGLGEPGGTRWLAHGFDRMSLHEVWAEALDANVASVRILQDLGMHEVGSGPPGTYLGRASHFRRFVLNDADYLSR